MASLGDALAGSRCREVSRASARHHHAKSARRIAVLVDEKGTIERVYDPAGTATFPQEVLADLKKQEL